MNVKFLSSRHQRLPKRQSAARLRKSGRIDDWQLLELERTLTRELGEGDLEVTPENLKKVFAHTTDSFLGLVRQVLDMQSMLKFRVLTMKS